MTLLTPALGGALAASLLGSPHCLGMCGGLATAASRDVRSAVAWHVGRIGTYTALGAVTGALGAGLPGPAWVPAVVAAGMLVLFSAQLAGLLPMVHASAGLVGRAGAWLSRRPGWASRLAFGAVSGLVPCGLTWTALALPVASGSAVTGAATMAVFGLGTLPALSLATFGLRRALTSTLWRRRALAGAVLLAGLASLALRGATAPGEEPACHRIAR